MGDDELHGLLDSRPQRVLTRQKEKQLSWGQLQQHAGDFTGKGLQRMSLLEATLKRGELTRGAKVTQLSRDLQGFL